MTTTLDSEPALDSAALEAALSKIPPLWPLKSFVAVNPFLGLVEKPFTEACGTIARTFGAAPLQAAADYLAAYRSGEISPADLAAVSDPEWTPLRLMVSLEKTAKSGQPSPLLPTVADFLDEKRPHAHWSVFVTEEISKWCGVTFDENQTTWNSPWKSLGLFAAWREAAVYDRNPESFGLVGFRKFVTSLPSSADEAIVKCLEIIAPDHPSLTDFLHRQLASISGWAGYIQYLVREDVMRGKQNSALRELLAIRLAYDAALFSAFGCDGVFRADWLAKSQSPAASDGDLLPALVRWQAAYEIGFQTKLAHSLAAQPSISIPLRPIAQAVFCIDVRSEIFRRHLEASLPGTQTIGFAGFFGFPVGHRAAANPASLGIRCPVLLVPPVETCEPLDVDQATALSKKRAEAGAWKAFQNSATSCFSFVESAGLAFGAALSKGSKKSSCCESPAPDFSDASLETRASLAEGALRNMSLTRNFARLVLICGHGSHSANNPYASALDCGACGGHAGDVNARLAAATFNDPKVRELLAARSIIIPADTHFIAGLHDTLSDDITLFDDAVPASHEADLATLKAALFVTGDATRRERSGLLGLSGDCYFLAASIRDRATDISQVRPEWGLANNAALIAAPRSRTAALKLDGRVFLHDYDASADPENKVLTLILCAPVVVASWINLQYYASRVDPQRFGSGNKVLHNVVGGIGVLEGNSGDLKVGLPIQSIHDGVKFIHEPRRLTVFIDASRENIDEVLNAQPGVRQLFDHGWIHLVALEGAKSHRRTDGEWTEI